MAKKTISLLLKVNSYSNIWESLWRFKEDAIVEDVLKSSRVREGYCTLPDGKKLTNDTPLSKVISKKYSSLPKLYDPIIEIGRFFVFCKKSEVNGDFFNHLGFKKTPALISRFFPKDLQRSLHQISNKKPLFRSLCAISTDRLTYEPGDKVSAFIMLTNEASQSQKIRCYLKSGGGTVPNSEKHLDIEHGLASVGWDGLPPGYYTAIVGGSGDQSECSFTVGTFSLSSAQATWEQQPLLQNEQWRGTALLKLYGINVKNTEVRVRLENATDVEKLITTNEHGMLEIELPQTNSEATYIEAQWNDSGFHSVQLPLPCAKKTYIGEVELCAVQQEHTQKAAGIHVGYSANNEECLHITKIVGRKIHIVANNDLEVAGVIGMFPGEKHIGEEVRNISKGQNIVVVIPEEVSHGYLTIGAISNDGKCFEKLLPVFASNDLKIKSKMAKTVTAGSKVPCTITTNSDEPTAVAVIVKDARLHSGGGLPAAAAKKRIERLEEEWQQFDAKENKFSECYFAGCLHVMEDITRLGGGGSAFAIDDVYGVTAQMSIPTPFSASPRSGSAEVYAPTMQVSCAPLEMNGSPMQMRGFPMAGSMSTPAPMVSNRTQVIAYKQNTLFADVIIVENSTTITLDVPTAPAGYTIELLALNSQGWVVHHNHFQAQQAIEIHTSSLPSGVSPQDSITGSIAVVAQSAHFHFTVLRDNIPFPCILENGTIVDGPMECESGEPVTILLEDLQPGHYTFTASNDTHEYVEKLWIKPLNRICERVRRLIILEEGQGFHHDECDHLFDINFVEDFNEVTKTCGQAIANYAHACCEQTAAKMLGAFLAWCVGDVNEKSQSMSSLYQGLKRLQGMWTKNGFTMYPNHSKPCGYWGPLAYRHLLTMQPLSQMNMLDMDMSNLLTELATLTQKAEQVYGEANEIKSCRDAYINLQKQPQTSLEFVLQNWQQQQDADFIYGVAKADDSNAVDLRAQTCFAAAVLLSDEQQSQQRQQELNGTLQWLGKQMKEGGRFYSTPDSAALVALLMSLTNSDFVQGGEVCLDDHDALPVVEANSMIKDSLPQNVFCSKGRVQFLLDAVYETTIPESSIEIGRNLLQKDGQTIRKAAVGEHVDLVVDNGGYKDGMVAHIALPPCMAFEKGGARLQLFEHDFAGEDQLHIRCKFIAEPDQEQHGMVVIRNMYDEEVCQPLEIVVS
ncbi:hypothetical protein [Candidatus Uabimicrobium amorphum]|uniref:General secretion pathway protein GspE n=1 Tax=Uabimicrobium amorphum TaxID=2596890 RepID=A0A5S9IS29_UABAM|nr:hypothetical protein [Candidatus Uabimicrobium amorphum]BBM86687.1 general secretion pathway protein GspE [Candidatus Uabimicrobium amorphum]